MHRGEEEEPLLKGKDKEKEKDVENSLGKDEVEEVATAPELLPLPRRSNSDFTFFSNFTFFETYLLFVGALGSVVQGFMPLGFYFYFGKLVDFAGDPDLADKIRETSFFFFMIAIVGGVSGWVSNGMLTLAGERVSARIRLRLFKSIARQDVTFFDYTKTGLLITRLSEDSATIRSLFSEKTGMFFTSLCQCIGGLGFAFYYSWNMTLVMLSTAPVLGVAIAVQGKLTVTFQTKGSDASATATSTAEEVITNFRTVKSFAGEVKEMERFAKALQGILDISSWKALLQGGSMGFTVACIWGSAALAFFYGGILVSDDDLTLGELITIFGMMLFAVVGLSQSLSVLPEIFKCKAAFNLVKDVVDTIPTVPYAGGRELVSMKGDVHIQHVSFKYPTRDMMVVNDLDITVKAGQRVALVGESGSGKSTIIALLERFYDPKEGAVYIDGVDLVELEPRWYHKQVALVSQEPVLFSGSIAENIKYGKEDASLSDVMEAAKAANAHNFIMGLPQQYKTLVGERGVALSGGQKQRVAIARAVLKNPKILLLDEATSALDSESEQLVQEALDKLMVGRTSIIIAHRLSTVRSADVIYVLSKGRLVEQGTHEELLEQGGVYRKLATRQLNIQGGATEEHNKETEELVAI